MQCFLGYVKPFLCATPWGGHNRVVNYKFSILPGALTIGTLMHISDQVSPVEMTTCSTAFLVLYIAWITSGTRTFGATKIIEANLLSLGKLSQSQSVFILKQKKTSFKIVEGCFWLWQKFTQLLQVTNYVT